MYTVSLYIIQVIYILLKKGQNVSLVGVLLSV